MNKEKEIEEMAEFIGETLSVRHEGDRFPLTVLTRDFLARRIIKAGYRKADEVRKEMAKEILQDLYDEASKYCDDTMGLNTYEIKQLAKKYGVEVDE